MAKISSQEGKKQVSFHLPIELYKAVKMQAVEKNISMNSLLLDAITLMLEKKKSTSEVKNFSGKDFLELIRPMMGHGDGDPNASKNIDAILYS